MLETTKTSAWPQTASQIFAIAFHGSDRWRPSMIEPMIEPMTYNPQPALNDTRLPFTTICGSLHEMQIVQYSIGPIRELYLRLNACIGTLYLSLRYNASAENLALFTTASHESLADSFTNQTSIPILTHVASGSSLSSSCWKSFAGYDFTQTE